MPYRRTPWTARPPSASPAPTRSPPSARSPAPHAALRDRGARPRGRARRGLDGGGGLAVRRDAAGNVLGRLGEPEEAPLVLGSHLDTVPDAGRFDGPLGVLAGDRGRRASRGSRARAASRSRRSPTRRVRASASAYLGSAAYRGSLRAGVARPRGRRRGHGRRGHARGGWRPGRARRRPLAGAGRVPRGAHRAGARARGGGLPVGVVSAIAGQTARRSPWRGARRTRGRRRCGRAGTRSRPRARSCSRSSGARSTRRRLVATVGCWTSSPGDERRPGRARLSVDVRHADDDIVGGAWRRSAAPSTRSRRLAASSTRGSRGRRYRRSRWPRRCASGSPRRSRQGRPRDPLAAERRGARRRRALPRLPGRDALRPVRRGDQPRPARVGRRGRRRGRPRRARAGGRPGWSRRASTAAMGDDGRPDWVDLDGRRRMSKGKHALLRRWSSPRSRRSPSRRPRPHGRTRARRSRPRGSTSGRTTTAAGRRPTTEDASTCRRRSART